MRPNSAKAVVVGPLDHARPLARAINSGSRLWRARFFGTSRWDALRALVAAFTADAIVTFGGPAPNVALIEIARGRRVPIIVVWFETDLARALEDPHLLEVIKNYGLTHVSATPALSAELRARGIDAPCASLVSDFEGVLDCARPLVARGVSGRPRKVAISGLHLFAAQVAAQVTATAPHWEPRIFRTRQRLEVLTALFTIAACDVWYSIGSPIGDRWVYFFARLLRKPRVIHWVGSDIQTLYTHRDLRKLCVRRRVTNLAEVDWTIDELAHVGIKATLAPLPPHFNARAVVAPLPERFTVLLYLPKTRGDFYGRREYERLFRAFAQQPVRFIVVGGGECHAPPEADVVRLGWCNDLTETYAQSTVLLRLTQHDGLSIMVLEALTCGRRVLWTQDFPFVSRVRNYADCEREIGALLQAHLAGLLQPQGDVAQIVSETYSPERCIANIEKAWDEAIRAKPAPSMIAEMPS